MSGWGRRGALGGRRGSCESQMTFSLPGGDRRLRKCLVEWIPAPASYVPQHPTPLLLLTSASTISHSLTLTWIIFWLLSQVILFTQVGARGSSTPQVHFVCVFLIFVCARVQVHVRACVHVFRNVGIRMPYCTCGGWRTTLGVRP